MFSSGAAIGGTQTITAHQLTEVPGKLAQVRAECSVAVPGTTMRFFAAVPVATFIRSATAAGKSVFV